MTAVRSPWRGRILAVLGIFLCAFSLRSAVASLSPMYDLISAEIPLSSPVIGLIGTLPPVCFAVFGLLTPLLERWLGLERLTVLALSVISAGLIGRAFAGDAIGLVLWTALIFAGVGMGNILLPPLVKKYFPDRIGSLMTLYTLAMALSTFLPPLVAVPMADAAGWRVSLGLWGVFAIAGLIPWLLMLWRPSAAPLTTAPPAGPAGAPHPSSEGHRPVAEPVTGPIATAPQNRSAFARMGRVPLVWALAVTFGTSSVMAYVTFAWFPTVMIDIAGVDAATAGFLLSLFAFIALPASLLVPVLVVRLRATRPLFLVGVISGLVGLTGLLLFPMPSLLWLWTVLYGLVGLLFPLALVLISIRSRTPESAVLLSSFVQSVGYTGAAVFPMLIGVLHDLTDSWSVPILVLIGVLLFAIPFGIIAGRRTTVEAEWERRHRATW